MSAARPTGPAARKVRQLDDSGAAIVEFALVLPLLVLLMLGLIEFGLAWRTKVNVESAVGLAARQNSNLGDTRQADYESLQSLIGSFGSIEGLDIDKVVIYRATGADGEPADSRCFTYTPQSFGRGISGACNIYGPDQVAALGATWTDHFGPTTTSCSSAWDRWWCPRNRDADQGDPPDYLGVRFEGTVPTVTSLFGSTIDMNANVVYRLEPNLE